MEDWIAGEPFDGIWCCASLLHLTEEHCDCFLTNLKHNLKSGGVIFISVKTGIETGCDERIRTFRERINNRSHLKYRSHIKEKKHGE